MTSRPLRYRTLAATLAAALQAGRYPAGSRLPSVRHLCAEHRASLATVTHALHDLEDAGLIEARARRGFFSCQAPAPIGVATRAMAMELDGRRRRLMSLAASQAGLLSLGHLALPQELLPVSTLRRLLAQQCRSASSSPLATGSVFGGEPLRRQLALRAPRLGCAFGADDIVVTQGEGESLQLCLRLLTQAGDWVVVTSPAPMRALELIASMGLRVLEIPVSNESGPSLEALGHALSHYPVAACVFDHSLSAAAGGRWSDADKEELVTLITQHQLPLIECDMMGELYRGAYRPRPLKAFDREDRVLYCGSFACISGPGFSLGYVVSGRLSVQLRAARAVHGELMPSLIEQVLAEFLASSSFDAHLRRLRQSLKAQVDLYQREILAQFPAGTRLHSGDTGYALWVVLPGGLDACTLLEQARARGYNFVPGAVFSTGTGFDHCLRLTAAHPLSEERANGIRVLADIANALLAEALP
ncbi:aminotransferase-like domain-containing protein [Roseateles oligotrophus]|uniref:PLP-dependent aminotransferase family protein n=1 Tax=Roseateles oligotrophus TaxID=1769250 RepID=A0ABT2YM17_9BURK|nr:PLP-dependent aminotransferase family protein [Roseateles oligotrophus]MCV2371118.1 PLP-dependent aminotransferase family protein [Roseateles oligotrophus]